MRNCKTVIFCLVAGLVAIGNPAEAQQRSRSGGREGGAGQILAAEASSYIAAVVRVIASVAEESNTEGAFAEFPAVSVLPFLRHAVGETTILFRPHLCFSTIGLDGGERRECLDGRYDASRRLIELSEVSWRNASCLERIVIVAHEIGRAAGVEGATYPMSRRFREDPERTAIFCEGEAQYRANRPR